MAGKMKGLRSCSGQTIIQKIVHQRKLNRLLGQFTDLYDIIHHKQKISYLLGKNSQAGFQNRLSKTVESSVYTDPQDIERLKKRIRQLKGRKTAEGELDPRHGLIQSTEGKEKSHHTWWIPIGAEPWLVFKVVSE